MLKEIKTARAHFFVDENNSYQGEYKDWYLSGQIWEHCYFVDNEIHGESKSWWDNGYLHMHCFYVRGELHGEYIEIDHNNRTDMHCFYVNGKAVSFNEIPYPKTPEEHMLFKLKYDLQLLPVDTKC